MFRTTVILTPGACWGSCELPVLHRFDGIGWIGWIRGCVQICSKLRPLSKLSVRRLQNRCTVIIFHQKHQKTYYFLHIFDQPRSQARAHGPGPRPSLGPGAHQVPGPGPCSRAQRSHSLRPGPMVARAQIIYSNSRSTAIGRLLLVE